METTKDITPPNRASNGYYVVENGYVHIRGYLNHDLDHEFCISFIGIEQLSRFQVTGEQDVYETYMAENFGKPFEQRQGCFFNPLRIQEDGCFFRWGKTAQIRLLFDEIPHYIKALDAAVESVNELVGMHEVVEFKDVEEGQCFYVYEKHPILAHDHTDHRFENFLHGKYQGGMVWVHADYTAWAPCPSYRQEPTQKVMIVPGKVLPPRESEMPNFDRNWGRDMDDEFPYTIRERLSDFFGGLF